ncbi:MAG: G1 family endopeptidase [Rudaea sp.]|uniref:G1 family glutamic endopeptidase n=1 Tax=Rudaea sp. TaxID=2136325 RepID=UPI0039E3F83C
MRTPKPGTQFAPSTISMSQDAESFYAKAARLNVTWLDHMECQSTGIVHGRISSGTAYSSVTDSYLSGNWSGYQISNSSRYVQSGWVVPTVTVPSPGYSSIGYYSSVWPGIGGGYGSGSAPLIQSGSTQDISASGVTSYYFWYEIVGGPTDTGSEVKITSPAAHHGDEVGAVTLWIPLDSGTGHTNVARMGVCNFTSSTCVHFDVPGTPAPGNSTEWIAEAPSSSSGVLPLANFHVVGFRNSCWTTALYTGGTVTCYPLTSGSSLSAIDLEQNVLSGLQILASPGAISTNGEDFDVTYYQPH